MAVNVLRMVLVRLSDSRQTVLFTVLRNFLGLVGQRPGY